MHNHNLSLNLSEDERRTLNAFITGIRKIGRNYKMTWFKSSPVHCKIARTLKDYDPQSYDPAVHNETYVHPLDFLKSQFYSLINSNTSLFNPMNKLLTLNDEVAKLLPRGGGVQFCHLKPSLKYQKEHVSDIKMASDKLKQQILQASRQNMPQAKAQPVPQQFKNKCDIFKNEYYDGNL